ncbi:sulfatase [Pelagicoccus mobilis]|uniref:Sulfatase n=1 Tax=Pelagicoccus mobilis TaxID=415221 RepID=A0A934VPI4_9BACT|nr:sulfatase [Pelagicoccus mobilis]MBK1875855.1 sulfatase [Pelagicoccus mobilis]
MRRAGKMFFMCVTPIVASLFSSAIAADEAEERPNVLFISVDDLKPWLGCYGDSVIKTPNIDRLASLGTVFKRSYCQIALCGPSRLSVMTGLRPDTTRVYSMGGEIFHIDTARKRAPHLRTLPGHFKANGYTSIGFGKLFDNRNTGSGQDVVSWSGRKGVRWEFNTDLYPEQPTRGGYQDPETRALIEEALKEAKKRGITKKRAVSDFLSGIEGTRPFFECLDIPDEAYPEGNLMAPPAVEAIKRFAKTKEPFFLGVGFYKPHLPFIAPKKYWDLYSPGDFDLASFQSYPEDGLAVSETDFIEGRVFHPIPTSGPISGELQRKMLHGYAACVSYVDAQVGKLLDALEETELLDDTIICLWGDHGFHLGDKQVWGKHTNFEQATRSPLIITSPFMQGGVMSDAVTEFIDVFPTLCELAGLESPRGLDGRSLVAEMSGDSPREAGAAVSQYMRNTDNGKVMGWAIRTPRYRYVEWRKISVKNLDYEFSGDVIGRELYDYKLDPEETRNFASSPEYRDVLRNMTQVFDETLKHLPERN